MQYSYSRVDCFHKCPFQYKCRYVDKLKTLPNYDPTNALILGTALHKGIETDVETAVKEYYDYFPIIDDNHINEAIKLQIMIPKVKSVLPVGKHEQKIDCENFVGYIDLICEDSNSHLNNIYDFKYTNNIGNYDKSQQLHLYKYNYGCEKINKLFYVFVPKIAIRQKKTETLYEFRERLKGECQNAEITIKEVVYDESKVQEFKNLIDQIEHATDYPKQESGLCERFCEYYNLCKNNDRIDII